MKIIFFKNYEFVVLCEEIEFAVVCLFVCIKDKSLCFVFVVSYGGWDKEFCECVRLCSN